MPQVSRFGPRYESRCKDTHANLSRLSIELIDQFAVLLKGGSAVRDIEQAFEIVNSQHHGHMGSVLGMMLKHGDTDLPPAQL